MKFRDNFRADARLLVVVASRHEYDAIVSLLDSGIDSDDVITHGAEVVKNDKPLRYTGGTYTILQCGVGKASAAATVAHHLTLRPGAYKAVLSFGIAGTYDPAVALNQTILATEMVYADEGRVDKPAGFVSLEEAGWGECKFASCNELWIEALAALADRRGTIATVSTISNSDELASAYAARTGAVAEGMEGAAIAQACKMLKVPMSEMRVISNVCGDRTHQPWDIPGALKHLGQVFKSFELI